MTICFLRFIIGLLFPLVTHGVSNSICYNWILPVVKSKDSCGTVSLTSTLISGKLSGYSHARNGIVSGFH